jgi:hypothetical protein
LILREGKEATQGVAYLEDGTMVVVDGARRFVNRTIDIVVTSVHQTPAGKMIFGRLDDRGDAPGARGTTTPASSFETSVPASGSGHANGNGHDRHDSSPRHEAPARGPFAGNEPT